MTDQNNLSGREIEILKLVAKGLTNREIAQKLSISPNTVKVHLSNIFEKISVASRTEATLYGIEHGLVDVPGGAESQPMPISAGWRDMLRKYAWLVIPLFLLIALILVTLTFNVFMPAPTVDELALAQLSERWRELAPLPAARTGMAAAAYNGEIYVIAGEGPAGVSGSVYRYSPVADDWVQLANKPTPVSAIQGVLLGEKIYIPGGLGADGRPTDVLEIYDPRRDTWLTGAALPLPISGYALADFEGQLYLFGGWDGAQVRDDVYVYDPGSDVWRTRTPMAAARRDAGAVALDDKIVVLGGRNAAGALKDALSYFPSRDAAGEDPWDAFVGLPEPRYGFGAASSGEALYLIGGSSPDAESAMPFAFQFTELNWRAIDVTAAGDLTQPVLIPLGLQVYVLNPDRVQDQTQLWRYQAIYYEVFLPIIQ